MHLSLLPPGLTPRRPSTLRLLVIGAGVALALTACGSADSASDQSSKVTVASLPSSTAVEGGSSAAGAASKSSVPSGTKARKASTIEEAQLLFQKCMQEDGFTMNVGENGSSSFTGDVNPEAFKASADRCQKSFAGVPGATNDISPEAEAKRKDDQARFAACMKTNGFEVTVDENGAMSISGETSESLPDQAVFDSAIKSCQAQPSRVGAE